MTTDNYSKTATEPCADGGPPWRSGVGLIILNQANQVLLGRRHGKDEWQLPQGGVNWGETPEQSVMRELDEEVGLQPQHVQLLARLPTRTEYDFPDYVHAAHKAQDGSGYVRKYRGQRHDWFVLRIIAPDSAIRLDKHHEIEFDAFCWATPQHAIDKVVAFKQPAYSQAFAMLEQLLAAPKTKPAATKISLLTL